MPPISWGILTVSLTSKQQEYLKNCDHRWNFKIGATGSGKSWLDYSVVIPKRMLALKGEGACLFLGNTRETLNRNVLEPMRELWTEKLVSRIHYDNSIDCFGHKAYVLGADKINSVDKIRGLTLEYAYCDELATYAPEVFEMLKSRLRCEHSHCDATCNPSDPSNFVKRFIDTDADIFCQTSTIYDNPYLPADFVRNLEKEYAGTVFYNRNILGQWTAAEGLIYRDFANALTTPVNNPYRAEKIPEGEHIRLMNIGVDFGGNGSLHAFVATAITARGDVYAVYSQRIKPEDADLLCSQLLEFCNVVFSNWHRIDALYCDNAEQVLIKQIRRYFQKTGKYSWLAEKTYNAKKTAIIDRIRLTAILMGGGRFHYLPGAQSLADAMGAAKWSEKHAGKDERLDDGSTDIDSLDAFEYTIEREKTALIGK